MKYEYLIYPNYIMYILDIFGSKMGSLVFVFKKHYQMEMKLKKKKTCPLVKFLAFSYGSGFFLKHMNYNGIIIQQLQKKTYFQ
jgi:hypothetical protein